MGTEMQLEIVDNVSQHLVSVLSPEVGQAQEAKIAVAFVSRRGLSMMETPIAQCLELGGYIEFLVGLDLSTTEPEALWDLYELCQRESNVELYCYADLAPSAVYHPKLYVMRAGVEVTAVVGSSNLTEGGLKRNVEINAVIRALSEEEVVSDIYAAYNKLKFHPKRVEPDEEFLSLYQELRNKRKGSERIATRDKNVRRLATEFREKAKSLRHPVATRKDLFGWQKIVFERLPEGQFKTRDIYQFEEEFGRYYPENRNIRPKTRQILQQLRDLDLIEHVRRETWTRQGG